MPSATASCPPTAGPPAGRVLLALPVTAAATGAACLWAALTVSEAARPPVVGVGVARRPV